MSTYEAEKAEGIRRAVACGRACTDIPTEALEAGVVEKMDSLLRQWAASDEGWNNERIAANRRRLKKETLALLRQIKGDQHDVR